MESPFDSRKSELSRVNDRMNGNEGDTQDDLMETDQQPGPPTSQHPTAGMPPQHPCGGWPHSNQVDPLTPPRTGAMKEQEFYDDYSRRNVHQMSHGQVAREEYEANKHRGHGDHFGSGMNVMPTNQGGGAPYFEEHRHQNVFGYQTQDQQKLQRSLQASQQMAYEVFANVITAIEELEQREAKKQKKLPAPKRSEAFIPDQSFKTFDDVVASVEGQLIVFQAHMGHCPAEVAKKVKTEMIDTTLTWGAAREDLKMPVTKVDEYALSLLEILYSGATQETFSILKKSWRMLSRSELMNGFRRIMAGAHKADKLDQAFADDPRKKAEALPIRQGENIADGLIRFYHLAEKKRKTDLTEQLKKHYEAMGETR